MSDKPTLFSDSEVFQRDRPKSVTNEQLNDFYSKMAREIIKHGYSTSDEEGIIIDLKEISPFTDSGFEMAKTLERSYNADYEIDSEFIQYLEGLHWDYRSLIEKNIKDWVKAHKPQSKFQIGDEILIEESLCYGHDLQKGKTAYINGIKEDTACYLVDTDPTKKGGVVLEYERVEPKVKFIKSIHNLNNKDK